MNDIIELEPCPFCGSKAVVNYNVGSQTWSAISCQASACHFHPGIKGASLSKLRANWNRRASTAREKRLRGVLERISELRASLGSVDGYDYRSGEEYGLRCAEIKMRQALKDTSNMRFDETYCSQCGGAFGPGDSGYSHCSDHGAKNTSNE